MEKRFIYALLGTLLFLIAWQHITAKYFSQHLPSQEVKDEPLRETHQINRQKEIFPGSIPEMEAKMRDLPRCDIGNYSITYSPLGGYIKTISIKVNNIVENSELPFKNIGFSPDDKNIEFTTRTSGKKIVFNGPEGQKKEFIFDDYTLEIKLDPPPATPVVLFSNYLHLRGLNQRYQELFYFRENTLKRFGAKKIKENIYENVEFAGGRDRYYCVSLLRGNYDVKWVEDNDKTNLYLLSPPSQIFLYIGPQIEKNLKRYDLQEVIYYGFFHIFGLGMVKLLYFFYFITKNWGLSLIGLSVTIYFIFFPLTMKSTKAMKKMQEIQPMIQELKAKYPNNPQKMHKETIELYKKYKVNPLGGCLPMVFQLPIFIALYQVLFRFVELKGASFLWIKDLSEADHLFRLPFPPPVNYFNLLPVLIMIVGLVQQKITVSSTTSPEQKKMGLFFGVFLGVIFYNFPSALVLYWFVQNLFTLGCQTRLARK